VSRFIALIAASLFWGVLPAVAQDEIGYVTGNELYRWCNSRDTDACLAYLEGVVDGLSAKQGLRLICVPKGVINIQLKDVAVNALRQHPEKRHMLAGYLMVEALSLAFPCKP
jgi:hypothetical protein